MTFGDFAVWGGVIGIIILLLATGWIYPVLAVVALFWFLGGGR